MRVLFLGAAGQMAQPALQLLANATAIASLVLADRVVPGIPDVTLASGGQVTKQALDVTDLQALAAAMQAAELVVNTTGPYYLLAESIVKTALQCGCHYVDICDDWEPTQALFALHEEAQANGLLVMLGAGASPGITNLLAEKAMRQLGHVDALYTGWSLQPDSSIGSIETQKLADADQPSAAVVHWMQQISGTIKAWANGHLSVEKPLQKTQFFFPGKGWKQGWSVGHPEAVTLPRQYPLVRRCLNLMVEAEHTIPVLRILAWLIDHRALSLEGAARWLQRLVRLELLARRWFPRAVNKTTANPMPALFALAEGKKGNQPARIGCYLKHLPNGGMAELTGIPLGIFAILIAERRIERYGVLAPEQCDIADQFFHRLALLLGSATGDPDSLLCILSDADVGVVKNATAFAAD